MVSKRNSLTRMERQGEASDHFENRMAVVVNWRWDESQIVRSPSSSRQREAEDEDDERMKIKGKGL